MPGECLFFVHICFTCKSYLCIKKPAGAYLVSITKIMSDCQQMYTGALLIINNHILGLVWGNQCFFLFNSHNKDEIGRMSAIGTAVLLRFDSLQSL